MTVRIAVSLMTLVAVVVAGASCRTAGGQSSPQTIQPGAPGQPSRVVAAKPTAPLRYTDADVQFMQGMIGHHAQALEMTDLLKARTTREDMRLLGLRIDVSQTDEIRMMQRWLQTRGQPLPDVHMHHDHGTMMMPGMLTPEEMSRLADAKGAEFDRLFLEFMIKHHEGALVMVKDLFASAGAAQDSDIFAFASDVEADQLIEIRRMRTMLAAGRVAPAAPRSLSDGVQP